MKELTVMQIIIRLTSLNYEVMRLESYPIHLRSAGIKKKIMILNMRVNNLMLIVAKNTFYTPRQFEKSLVNVERKIAFQT